MKTTSRFWRIAAVLFLFVNAAGAIYAIVEGEQMHAEMHLALFGAAFVGYAFSRAGQTRAHGNSADDIVDSRVEELQRSIDAMSLELERLGEAQRFREKLSSERRDNPADP